MLKDRDVRADWLILTSHPTQIGSGRVTHLPTGHCVEWCAERHGRQKGGAYRAMMAELENLVTGRTEAART